MTKKKTPRRILAQPYDYSVQDLVDKIQSKDIDLKPAYQRNYIWDTNDSSQNKCSRLIESLLLNIPIPVIYFAEQAETLKYEVIDGQQRLRTFHRFIEDEFPLNGLKIRDDINGKKYSELEEKDRNEIRKRSIRAIVILNESDEEVKYEVFERLNLGSIQLTPQEIRNNTLRGPFNDLLKELASRPLFREMLKLRLKNDQKNMAHEELVLRFFAYYNGVQQFENLSFFLTNYMEYNRNLSESDLKKLSDLFDKTINLINKYLDNNSFAIFKTNTGKWNSTTNRALYDAEMLAFSKFTEDEIKVSPEEFKTKLKKVMGDNKFKKSLNEQAGGRMVEARTNIIKNILLGKVFP
ncbi:MAG: DUF262 domain-containing protein [Thiomargarita sp.]|nr:DUF262 domain-containing protein [Thiomargarita sp.]